ncbi:unnamed protein product [Cylicocyclus nassatus]|uniref:Uncharacterized protein n=1 Tax=Cylicocyclus nassatus TaxID=53992 RepID=A0AA36GNM0_CYLNA|nr:unnamed protein product [Cylicocyclus nassatus]
MDGPTVASYDQLQEFIVSAVLFLVFALALTILCSALLWCHFYVFVKRDNTKKSQLDLLESSYCDA